MNIKGYIENFKFRSAENGYGVFVLVTEDIEEGEVICTGLSRGMEKGDYVELDGEMTEHPSYGPQFKYSRYTVLPPSDTISVEKYLASGAIKGIGPALAMRIVKKFGEDAFRIMESEPERLVEIKGISENKAREIAMQMEEKKELREAMIYLQGYGVGNSLAVKIYEKYGLAMYTILKENPYKIAEDVRGIGFKTADEIAMKMGMAADASERMEGGILYCLQLASGEGHTYLPKEELLQRSAEILEVAAEVLELPLSNLAFERKVIVKTSADDTKVFLSFFYFAELTCAREMNRIQEAYGAYELSEASEKNILEQLDSIMTEHHAELDKLQKEAVLAAIRNGVLILTGGPGTGKTTTMRIIIEYYVRTKHNVLLAAPTGRAAKRLEETTGYCAKTIHRMLEVAGVHAEDGGERAEFGRNEYNPLEADVVIIDEMSMVDTYLFEALLQAIPTGTRLIMAGDADQLPSVGPGNILKDLIRSEAFPVVKLEKIYRQNLESDIIVNAHRINKGEDVELSNASKEFCCVERNDVQMIYDEIVSLNRDRLPRFLGVKPYDIQVLTPMRKGNLGVENLNIILQEKLNPPAPGKKEIRRGEMIFRVGDKVMQIKNNYEAVWTIRGYNEIRVDEGKGVFNGDVGVVKSINEYNKILTVLFDDNRQVEYSFGQLEELEPAFAITIHKSQGSEYPAVILPLLDGPRMLLNRNLLYTAVTRAAQSVVILGRKETVRQMIKRGDEQKRYTDLLNRIKEVTGHSIFEETIYQR